MARAFRGTLPEELVSALRPGDLLFVQTLGSLRSWLIMYLTKSEISHVAMYAGDRTIRHATTSGVATEPIDVLLDERTIVLPCSLSLSSEQRHDMHDVLRRFEGAPFNWSVVILKGVRIVLGRDLLYYRASFIADCAMVLLLLDVPILAFGGGPFFLFLFPAYLVVVGMAMILSRLRPLTVSRRSVAKPVEVFLLAAELGGAFHLRDDVSGD